MTTYRILVRQTFGPNRHWGEVIYRPKTKRAADAMAAKLNRRAARQGGHYEYRVQPIKQGDRS